jgi:hypothetical protein
VDHMAWMPSASSARACWPIAASWSPSPGSLQVPARSVELTLMLDQYLRRRGLRNFIELTLLSPLGRAFAVGSASNLVQPIMRRRGIGWALTQGRGDADRRVRRLAPGRRRRQGRRGAPVRGGPGSDRPAGQAGRQPRMRALPARPAGTPSG